MSNKARLLSFFLLAAALIIACDDDDPAYIQDLSLDAPEISQDHHELPVDTVEVRPDQAEETDAPDSVDDDGHEAEVEEDTTPLPPSCAPGCSSFRRCEEPVPLQCAHSCDTPETRLEALDCLMRTKVGDCEAIAACLGLYAPFQEGPYGVGIKERAGDFSVETTQGTFTLSESWTGRDHYVFLVTSGGYDYPEALWSSSITDLVESAPRDTHFFFGSFIDKDGTDRHLEHVQEMEGRVGEALATLGEDAEYWAPRFHFITERFPVPSESPGEETIAGWLGEVTHTHGLFHFAIDRQQRLRHIGLLQQLGDATRISNISYDLEGFEYDWRLEKTLQLHNGQAIPFAEQEVTLNAVDGVIELPSGDALRAFDKLEVELALECQDHDDPSTCGEWDYLAQLFLCDLPSEEHPDQSETPCTTELARWVTPYAREGRWLTDISPMLAYLGDGGPRRLRFWASTQPERCVESTGECWETPYVVTLLLRFSADEEGTGHPISYQPLWQDGGPFDENYNDLHPPISFRPPTGATKAKLVAFITGHGFGAEIENCAEFCNHTHAFSVNGALVGTKSHPEADDRKGCAEQVSQGVAPNQYGTWPLGRGGWCPGQDVPPYVVDISDEVDFDGENEISYEAGLWGEPYVPELIPEDQSTHFRGNIASLRSMIVFY